MNSQELLLVIERAFALLGESENNPDTQALITDLGSTLPLKRPPGDETYIGLESQAIGLDLNFKYFSAAKQPPASHGKKEMYLADLFVDITTLRITQELVLPLGVTSDLSRNAARSRYGTPEWSSIPRLHSDRWRIDGNKLHLTFNVDEDRVTLATYSSDI